MYASLVDLVMSDWFVPSDWTNLALGLVQDAGAAPAGSAPAGAPAGAAGGTAPFPWPMFIIIGALFYFLLIAPESKKKKAREAMLTELSKNDRVYLTSGIFGTITKLDEGSIHLKIDDNVTIKVLRAAIQGREDELEEAADKDSKK